MERSNIVVIIPAYNEENTIRGVILSLKNISDVIIVDDGSVDKTGLIAQNCGVQVIYHKKNLGYDSALNTGFKEAAKLNYKNIITLDADGQHKVEHISTIIHAFDNGADVVFGERDKKQRISEVVFGVVTNLLWGIRDPLCGLKGYKTSIYNEKGSFSTFNSIGTELALYCVRTGKKAEQFKFSTNVRKDKSRFGSSISANLKILSALYKTFI